MVMVVAGQPIPVTVDPADTVLDLRRRAVAAAGYDEGARWEVRDPVGAVVDQTLLASQFFRDDWDRLFANLPAGVGG